MPDRNRPRLNITLDPEVKERAQAAARTLDVSTSRLVEEVLREFLRSHEEDPMVGRTLRREIEDRKNQNAGGTGTPEQIKNILEQMDEA